MRNKLDWPFRRIVEKKASFGIRPACPGFSVDSLPSFIPVDKHERKPLAFREKKDLQPFDGLSEDVLHC